jgi:hypothetical protein
MKQILKTSLLLSLLFVVIYSCKKDQEATTTTPIPVSSSGTITATVTGRVLDENNSTVSNASVSINGQLTTTDINGIFLLNSIAVNSRCIVTITKPGYFNCNHAFIANANAINYIRVVLMSNAQTHTLSASSGGTVSLTDGSSIQFAPNSFVNAATGSGYTGTVSLCVKHLSPDSANFGFMIPGGDLLGKDFGGNDVSLYTYGMLGAELKGSSGEQLQLATGSTATITMPIASSQIGTAPSPISLWYFDETTSLWKREGVAMRVGTNYVATVSHFSWWNCDVSADRATIIGKVLDCNNVPMPNVVVTVNGFYTLITNNLGVYSNWVPAGMTLSVQVLSSANYNLFPNSQPEIVPSLSANQTYFVPDLIVACPAYVTGNLKKCTGESIDGTVMLNWPGGTSYQFSQNGNFSLVCPSSTFLNISVFSNYNSTLYSYSDQFTSAPNNATNNLGNLLLCDSLSGTSAPNAIIINGGPFVNQYFVLLPATDAIIIGNTTMMNFPGGQFADCFISGPSLHIDITSPGSTTWVGNATTTSLSLNLTNGFGSYFIVTNWNGPGIPTGVLNLTDAGNVGEPIIGSFSGTANCFPADSSSAFVVSISGHFDVIRQQ